MNNYTHAHSLFYRYPTWSTIPRRAPKHGLLPCFQNRHDTFVLRRPDLGDLLGTAATRICKEIIWLQRAKYVDWNLWISVLVEEDRMRKAGKVILVGIEFTSDDSHRK